MKEHGWECEETTQYKICENIRGKTVSMHRDGSVRFSRDDCNVKVEGKKQKGKCGVELT